MKKCLFSIMFIAFLFYKANAQVIIYEPYNYIVGTTSNDPDGGVNGGAGLPATNVGGSPTGTSTGLYGAYGAEASVVAGLTYPNLVSSGGAHNITNATFGTAVSRYRFMTTDPFQSNRAAGNNGNFGVDGQSLFISFLAQTSSNAAAAFSFLIAGTRNVYVENTADRWTLNDNKAGAVGGSNATLNTNTPTLIVIKIDFKAGATDVVSLYKNPPIGGALGIPDVTLTVAVDYTINSFQTRPFVASTMTIDELRMGLTYADVTPSTVLPVQLLSFTAQPQSKAVALQWQTTHEVNSSHFNIQRSTNGSSFTTVGSVNAKGAGSYGYADDVSNFNNPVIYYRIEIVDKDGSLAYSKIVAVTLTTQNLQFAIYPNPVTNQLQVNFATGIKANTVINIINSLGMVVKQINAGNTDAGTLKINTTELAAGVYIVQLISGGTIINTQKVIKQ